LAKRSLSIRMMKRTICLVTPLVSSILRKSVVAGHRLTSREHAAEILRDAAREKANAELAMLTRTLKKGIFAKVKEVIDKPVT